MPSRQSRPMTESSLPSMRTTLATETAIGLGVFTVWLIVFVVFKFVDHRLPWILAVAVTYGIAAYIILRALSAWA